MPYPNEHSARIESPSKYVRFSRENDKFGDGIHAIWGITREEKTELQAIRFDADKYTVAEAKKWLADHKIKYIRFEPATGKKKDEETGRFREVPTAACRFEAGEFTLGDNGDDAKSAPIRILARTGKPMEHWYWGLCVHDMEGMSLHKSRIAVDYCHDRDQVIGYLNRFEQVPDPDGVPGLVCSGALVPYGDSDRAQEVIRKAKAGVPWEASIFWGGEGIEIEDVEEGKTAEVNGYTLEGRAVIFRKWPLRGVAVTPYGADMETASQFAAKGDNANVTIQVLGAGQMKTGATVETNKVVDAEAADAEAKAAAEAEAKAAADGEAKAKAEAEANAAAEAQAKAKAGADAQEPAGEKPAGVDGAEKKEAAAPQAEGPPLTACVDGKRFIEAFGDKGARWFVEGVSFEAAQELHAAELTGQIKELREAATAAAEEIKALKARVAELTGRGEEDAVSFQPADDSPEAKRRAELALKVGDKLAAMAGGMKIPRKGDQTKE